MNQALSVDTMPNNCHYVLPTMAIETWLLALYDNHTHPSVFAEQLDNYENYCDPERMLLEIGHDERHGGLDKTGRVYANYADKLVRNLRTARRRCSELRKLCSLFQSDRERERQARKG